MIGIIHSQFDQDATRFLNDASITNPTQRLAINYLARELKLNSLWTKFSALYPVVGGNETAHSKNLISNTFNSTFFGGWTHSSTGMLPNGTTGYALTGLIPSAVLSLNSTSTGFYSRTATPAPTVTGVQIGCGSLSDRIGMQIIRDTAPSFTISTRINTSGTILTSAITSSQGLFTTSRTASNLTTNYRNATSLGSNTAASTALPTVELCIGATNTAGVISAYSSRELALVYVSAGLTAGEVSTLSTIVQQYQTILSRAV
jgi:hypothetical protein